jgi:ABC-2 type transport system ATP-binding protein
LEPAIEIRGLVKSYPRVRRYREVLLRPFSGERVPALRGLDLTVRQGELVALLGPNGAGKTTLLKVLTSLVLADAGSVRVLGVDAVARPREARRHVGIVLDQERGFYWRLTGVQNLAFFAALDDLSPREARGRIAEVLAMVGMERDGGRMFKDYSSGMRQKMAIARALLRRPQVLIMDEPTRSLDPVAAERLRAYLRGELVDRLGKTVLVATHNLAEAEGIADRIAVLASGTLRAMGTAQELRALAGPAGASLGDVFAELTREAADA